MGPRTFLTVQEFLCIIVLHFMCCLLSGSMLGLMATSSKRASATSYVTPVCCSQSPCPRGRLLLTYASAGDTQTLKSRSGSVPVESLCLSAHTVLFELSKHLSWVWGLIINVLLPLLQSYWVVPLSLDVGCLFLVGSNILLSMVFQQQVAILEFSQEKMSACPSSPPSVFWFGIR